MGNEFSEIDPENIENRINSAILKFRSYRSSQEERRDAVRNLADILEFLKPKLKLVLTQKDESDLLILLIILVFAIIMINREQIMINPSGMNGCSIIISLQSVQL